MIALSLTILATTIPVLLAALGGVVGERSGVLNLGLEGMMLLGALAALAATLATGSPYIGMVAGALGGLLASCFFGLLVITFMTNQVATGLALTIFATGLTSLAGVPLIGKTAAASIPPIILPVLSDIPFLGPVFFSQDLIFYIAFAMLPALSWFLFKSRWGTILRAVGDQHDSAHALGYNVKRVRWLAVGFGGMMAGLGGAYIPLAIIPHWSEGLTGGRGWIALALIVFASWMPWRVLLGALIFGGITIIQFVGQARGWGIPSQFLSMLPYLATIIALVAMSAHAKIRVKASLSPVPNCIGKAFEPKK